MKERFTFAFTNIRGILSKIDHLNIFLRQHTPTLFACSETKLSNKILDSELSFPNYTMIRDDKPPHHGLCLYLHSSLTAQHCSQYENPQYQYICLRFILHSNSKIIFFIYRSPSANSDIFSVISDKIDSALLAYPNSEIVVAGDFNIHHEQWLTHSSSTDTAGQAAFNFSISHNLTQLVNFPTHIPDHHGDRSNTLDLFLTSHPDLYDISSSSPLGSSDHAVITCTQTFMTAKQPKQRIQKTWHYKLG